MHSHAASGNVSASSIQEPYSHIKLFLLTSGLIGLQFCWAVQIGYVTKSLLELGLPQRFVSYAWLAGPIAGVIVQPTVGIISDRCTFRFGRRRPFLVIGSMLSVVCLFLFSYAGQIGNWLGDTPKVVTEQTNHIAVRPRALVVAILSFWALDFAINAAQGPLRALMADVVPPSQHTVGNAYFAFATGIGNCTGSLLGSLRLTRFFPFFPEDLQALYTSAAIVLVITMAGTVISTKEVQFNPSSSSSSQIGEVAPHVSDYDSLRMDEEPASDNSSGTIRPLSFTEAAFVAPHPFWPAFLVQCFSWFGWFALFVFGTSWVGAEVFNGSFTATEGSPKRELYDAGVRLGNFGMAMQSVLTVIMSPLLPLLIRRTSAYTVYLSASLLLGIALSSALVLTQKWQAWIAVMAISSTGFAWAVTMTVPWSLMSEAVAKMAPHHAGIYSTMFNLSQCFPEILLSLVAEEVERITGKQAAMMGLGGLAAFIAAGIIIFLRVGKSEREVLGENDDEGILTPLGSDHSSDEMDAA